MYYRDGQSEAHAKAQRSGKSEIYFWPFILRQVSAALGFHLVTRNL